MKLDVVCYNFKTASLPHYRPNVFYQAVSESESLSLISNSSVVMISPPTEAELRNFQPIRGLIGFDISFAYSGCSSKVTLVAMSLLLA